MQTHGEINVTERTGANNWGLPLVYSWAHENGSAWNCPPHSGLGRSLRRADRVPRSRDSQRAERKEGSLCRLQSIKSLVIPSDYARVAGMQALSGTEFRFILRVRDWGQV